MTRPFARSLAARFFWRCLAGLYLIWLATVLAIALAPAPGAAPDARVLTGLAEIHQDPRSHESVVLRQTRRP